MGHYADLSGSIQGDERLKIQYFLWVAVLVLSTGCATPQQLVPPVEEDSRDIVVYFVPLDDFSVDVSASLAQHFSQEFGVRMKSALPMGSRELRPFEGTQQYAAEDIFLLAKPVLERLPGRAPNASYVLLTNRDINQRSRIFRYLFSWHDSGLRASVISTAQMTEPGDLSQHAADLLADRYTKMIRRAIGEIQFGWKRSSNINDVMYSPIMGVDDLDRMGRAAAHISNDDLKQLVKEKPIWCLNLDANGTCSSVTHYGLTKGNSIPASEYTLSVGPTIHGKLRTSFTGVFSESGLCMIFDEAYVKALASFVTTNNFARITPDDQAFSEKGQVEFNSKLMEPIHTIFGKEYCGRFEVSKRNAKGEISEIKATYFIQDVQQSFPLTLFTLFPEGSEDVRLRALPH